jgi:hypothetical protein
MRSQVAGDFNNTFSTKINELVEQFASSSESLYDLCHEMKSEIQELKATLNLNHSQYTA